MQESEISHTTNSREEILLMGKHLKKIIINEPSYDIDKKEGSAN